MKISELSTSKAADVLCEITPFVANITGDKALMDVLKEKISGGTAAEIMAFGANKISALTPILFKDHKADIFGILSVLNETTVEAVLNQNILVTMAQIKSAVQDKELLDFFRSWRQVEETE